MTEFSDLGLSPATLAAVAATGYTTATPIQAEAIPMALQGLDVLGIAQTGTGKTAAFTLPMIDRLAAGRAKARMPRALVIAPTRELADQVSMSFEKYAKDQKLSWALLIGGVSFKDQELKLDRGVDVLIATPGRLLDHFERGKLLMTGVQIMVVDEADRMLDMGFIPDLERIFKLTPAKKQTLFFSATMPPEITRLTKQFLRDPVRIEASRPATTAETITQNLVRIPTADPKAKRTALRELIARADVKNGIVFCNRKAEVDVVAKSLKKHGLDAAPIHGDLDQQTRMKTLESFRNGSLRLLCASDVAARGLDIPDVSHVFNYDVPHHADDYVHRIGRTGRAGKTGQAFTIVTPADSRNLDKVLKLINTAPVEITLEGIDWSSIKDEPRSPRSGGRDRGPARSRERP
ncbi:DEAD/DEAH box helicase, partial [Phenylobacterium sp.]|uniref:DEAD/DEAH box helicase n=2 Tax=Phenylobacterium sp. TaxID=1871053 RepID=UPI0037C7A36D